MVFRTIIENIASFFQKEGSSERKEPPAEAPEPASDALGDIDEARKVVQQPLPEDSSPQESKLPSADALREAYEKQREPAPKREPVREEPEELSFDERDLAAFEQALNEHQPSEERPSRPRVPAQPLEDGFFSSFKEFLEEGELDPSHLDGDLLHKMRSYHQRRREGKEPLLHKRSAEDAVRRRLQELQGLEHEWQRLYSESQDVERAMIHVEEEIDERTRALKTLLSESKQLSVLAREAPEERSFVLADGSRVRSLGSLLRSLESAPWLFGRHVTASRHDFADWVRDALGFSELSERLRRERSLDGFRQALC